ncbi:dihydropyrimidinase-related protein 3 isoform X1 [Solea senegalensis]|uniref:Dihydropyrimidinase-related protein 3 isoform X1 n=1 Tax=Solea senegalensis TaxID=28829 RepID=A0AAV6SJI3_SOLSE|nr:dihydropyrimidinase-related protein 3 isoform X1 [Solea senegalensis]
MAERRVKAGKAGEEEEEEDFPVYLARPGTADQVARQKRGGLFCSVEDAFESKTLDFDALSVGQRGSVRTPTTGKRGGGQEVPRSPATVSDSGSSAGVESGRGGKDSASSPRSSGAKEVLQNLEEEEKEIDIDAVTERFDKNIKISE